MKKEDKKQTKLGKASAKREKPQFKQSKSNLNKINREKQKFAKEKKATSKKIKESISAYDNEYKRPSRFKSTVIKLSIVLVVLLTIYLTISHFIYYSKFKSIVTQMSNLEKSTIVLEDGTVCEQIGRQKLKLEKQEIPDIVKKAYVAIEDERFYSHHGVDVKRTTSAIANYILHFGKSSFGGSTITQQLVKNYTGDDTSSVKRKVFEWYRAFLMEQIFTKDEILDNYLSYIYQGQGVYGVQSGAKYYFNKTLDELSLEEIAFLAGINISPNSYNPFDTSKDNSEIISKRTKIVLGQMKKFNYITDEEYEIAVANVDNGLKFIKGNIPNDESVSSYHTDAVYSELILDVSNYYNISEKFALNYLENAGLTIVSTQNLKIQNEQNKEFEKTKYQITENGESSQSAMVILDHTTGYVLSCNGGLGKKTDSRTYNRATMSKRQTGSSIKPISVLAPGIENKVFTASTIYDDTPQEFGEGWYVEDFAKPLGDITVRRATESSQNVPFVEMLKQIGVETSVKYCKNFGLSTITKQDETLVLALGGLEIGVTPLEMAGAYATIANDGVYIEPTFYKSVTTKDGKELKCNKQKTKKVISKQTAYILKNILQTPVEGTNGTATYCKISGVDVAAKTGTSDENYDRWLCGFTPYYTGVCWFGYDNCQTVNFDGKNPAGLIFANVFSRIHNGLQSARFQMPSGVVKVTVCKESGQIAKQNCTNTYEEVYLTGTEPGLCHIHTGTKADKVETNVTEKKDNDIIQNQTKEIDEKELQKDHEAVEVTPTPSVQTNVNTNTNTTNTSTNVNTNTNSNSNTNSNTNTNTNTNSTNTNNTNTNVNTVPEPTEEVEEETEE